MSDIPVSHSTILQAQSVYHRIIHLDNKAEVFVTGENLLRFIQCLATKEVPVSFAVSMLHHMDYLGKIMDKTYFPTCLAREVNVPVLCSYDDVERLHRRFKDFFLGRLLYEPELIEVWDGQNLLSSEEATARYAVIMGKFSGLSLQSGFDQRQVEDLQTVLSIITLPPAFAHPEIDNVYRALLQTPAITKIYEILFSAASIDIDIISTLKALAYLYSAFPREKLRDYYQANKFLDSQLWQKIIQTLPHPNPEVKRMVMVVCALLARNVPTFNQYLIFDVNVVVLLCGQTTQMSELSGLREALLFYKYWMAGCKRALDQTNAPTLANYANQVFTFAFSTFSANISMEVSSLCLQVICEALVLIPELSSEASLSFNKLAYVMTQDSGLLLAKNILLILNKAILTQKQPAVKILTSNSEFINFVCKHMASNESHVHCITLQIIQQLACSSLEMPVYSKAFFESLMVAATIPLVYSATMISEILLRIVQNSFYDEWKMELLVSSNAIGIFCDLFKHVLLKDKADSLYFENIDFETINRPNMTLFRNCITGMYLFIFEDRSNSVNAQRRIQAFNKALQTQYFEVMTQVMQELFRSYSKFVESQLREDTIIKRDPESCYRVFKLTISNLQNTPHFQRARALKRELLSGLYRFFPIQQLQADRIPIILWVSVQTPPSFNYRDNRATFRIPKGNFTNLYQTVSQSLEIKNFEIRNATNEIIDDDSKYQQILQEMFKNHRSLPSFTLQLSVSEVQAPPLPRMMPDPMHMATYRPRMAQMGQAASYNVREIRDVSPLRVMTERKPACRYCHKPQVVQHTGLCEECVVNQNMRRF